VNDTIAAVCRWRADDGSVAVGYVEDDVLTPVSERDLPPLVRAAVNPSGRPLKAGGPSTLDTVELLPPVIPRKIVCVGLNYRDHADETGLEIPTAPLLFAKFPSAAIGPNAPIRRHRETRQLDYEAELGVVIGAPGRDIRPDDVADHVLGVVTANDVSARDAQFADGQWTRGKSFDTFAPFGPWLTLASPGLSLDDRAVRSWVNGELRQESNTRHLIFDVPALVSYISRYVTLETGDLILTGTPGGVGMGFDPARYLASGDVVEVEVAGLGRLRNEVVDDPSEARVVGAAAGLRVVR
jgi:2-keto-4-pentenoate hydratase/2-oxohepta-3-ene-1,7-dioic acid hydratase in catechol pathway